MEKLKKHIPKRIDKLIEIHDFNEFSITPSMTGLISIYAEWSVYSMMNAAQLLKVLDEGKLHEFSIYIINIDQAKPEKQQQELGFVSQGYFESVWVENGIIRKSFQKKQSFDQFVKFLKHRTQFN